MKKTTKTKHEKSAKKVKNIGTNRIEILQAPPIGDGTTEMKHKQCENKQGCDSVDTEYGDVFPDSFAQRVWVFVRGQTQLHFSDGAHTYSFRGRLDPVESTILEKIPDVPLPDIYTNSISKYKAQVHRSNAGSIYFTLQDGRINHTHTFRHMSGNRWRAVRKGVRP